ncbi:MAG: DNA polymerase [Candidatus Pelagibacter sp. TMED203]|jgi:hypothetical protein|nr:MAG: DNA polymerase [Candidatus Pelagibacter sp. TMED203]|tara:strand:+ start:101 stop:502 length:402 start_codon:yes stop_codon:yes gene_type:complete
MAELKDWLNSINYTKKDVMVDEYEEKKYPAFIINKCLAPFPDTLLYVNELNRLHGLDSRLQYDFLLNSLRKRKRFAKWLKSSKIKDLDVVKEYYGYSNEKAKQALNVLTEEQIKIIKIKLTKGGKNGRIGVDT